MKSTALFVDYGRYRPTPFTGERYALFQAGRLATGPMPVVQRRARDGLPFGTEAVAQIARIAQRRDQRASSWR